MIIGIQQLIFSLLLVLCHKHVCLLELCSLMEAPMSEGSVQSIQNVERVYACMQLEGLQNRPRISHKNVIKVLS